MYIKLSHNITSNSPVYPGNPPPLLCERKKEETERYACNTSTITLFTHNGTHIDPPLHFNPEGKSIDKLPLEWFIYTSPKVINISKKDSELISYADLKGHNIKNYDLILFRTGFSKFRNTDPARYSSKNPGLSNDAAMFLIEECNSLKAVGIDTISFGAYQHPEEGIAVHKILCGINKDRRFILLIEDLFLEEISFKKLLRVYALPLFWEEGDGSPCTVIAEVEK